jgi:ABC-type polar amino acid transport system ATPase subunit
MSQITAEVPAIRMQGVRKSFGPNVVLDGIDLEFPPGSTTCIIGRSGSGKSTLLRCINGLEKIDSGDIFIGSDKLSYEEKSLNRMRSNMGMVFQHFNLFPNLTVIGNVTLALRTVHNVEKDAARVLAERALERVGMLSFADTRPDRLSGGQQQRVAIARSIASGPGVMLFDEATSALDPELVKGVLTLMRDLAGEGMTMVVVTHEMGFAREVSDHVAFVAEGRIAEFAVPGALFDAPQHPALQRFLQQVL